MHKAGANCIWVPVDVESAYRESTKPGYAGRVHKWRNVPNYRSTNSEKALVHHNIVSKGGDLTINIAKIKGGTAFVLTKESHIASRSNLCKHEAKKTTALATQIRSRIQSRDIERITERFKGVRREGVIDKTLKGSFGYDVLVRGVETGWGVAPALEIKYEAPKIEHYKGVVKSLQGDSVLVTVSSPGDWDRWEARIPLAAFDKFPEEGKEFSCKISVSGPDINVRASILPKRPPRSLKDFGIDKEELLDWASKIDL